MAGEKFIALEETSQEIKASVETVNTSVNEIKVDVGDGDGTDLVSRVAQLQAKVDQLLSKGSEGNLTDIFLNYNWSNKIRLGQLEPGKTYMIYYVPKFHIDNGSMQAIFTIRNGEGGHGQILINDYIVHDEYSRFSYDINMPFCLFKLKVTNNNGSLMTIENDTNVNLYYKEIK
jgi:hypothetical protein